MATTIIGKIILRTDVPARGRTADGKERVFLNFIPDANFGLQRMWGSYMFWRTAPYEGAVSRVHVWKHFDSMRSNQWKEVLPRSGDLMFPQQLQWGLEQVAHDLNCDIHIKFDEEFLDPDKPEARAIRCCIHLFGLTEVRNDSGFLEAVATRIDREARRWSAESSDWSIEDI
ncbi:MAG TPA: hypothetical protein VGE59_03870 [Patescibacteria group bacterium]